ncbi:hypothetical protein [Microbacterium sp. NIBRBAC000506063]|uniref:hypothetical protein n=1 Tax=Microbacterium sp. NIBRBAC000506063 TaxID=2734618 RepID=UPI001BB71E0E|nr:hypothetical protein [Microbacterium sp. NIBRBAC000506063]QTV81018.1 hypothetical protein KAE78_13685 [Microbacterium sp. NIBRBAC000506063]
MSDEPGGDATTNDVPDSDVDQMDDDGYDEPLIAEPPHPINWNLLSAEDAEAEWSRGTSGRRTSEHGVGARRAAFLWPFPTSIS